MQAAEGAWVGWSGAPGDAPEPFDHDGMHLVGVPLSSEEVEDYYEGFSNATLWPLYHDVIAPPEFHRAWWETYTDINQRFAEAAAAQAAPGATVWVHDYQLQLVPRLLRELRPDVRIGFFIHIPFPGYEIFAQLPWRKQIVEGLLGADLLGFQRPSDATNFLRAAAARPASAPAARGCAPRTAASCRPARSRSRSTRRPSRRWPDRRVQAGQGDPRGARGSRGRPARGGPARLHQGDPAPAQGVRRDPRRRQARATGGRARAGRQPQPRARPAVPRPSRRGRGDRRPDQRDAGELGSPPIHYLHQSYPARR